MANDSTELQKLKKQLQEEQEKQAKKAAASMKQGNLKTRGRKTAAGSLGISTEPANKRARKASAAFKAELELQEDVDEVFGSGKGKNTPSVDWKKVPKLTDELLTLIEDNDARRIALGFKKSGTTKGSGQTSLTIKDHCKKISDTLLIKHPSGMWSQYIEDELWNIVRQRINYLKKRFSDIREKMEASGHGFIMAEDNEDLGTGDKTPWGKVRKDFPWYERMMGLMQDSPVFDTKACSNSMSSLDEGLEDILPSTQRKYISETFLEQPNRTPSPTTIACPEKAEELEVEPGFFIGEWDPTPPPESPIQVNQGTKASVLSPSVNSSFGTSAKGLKRGRANPHDQLDIVLSRNRETRENMLKMKLESRLLEKREAQKAAALEADKARAHQLEEAEKARAHELKVMEMKIQLARFQSNNGYVSESISSPLSATSMTSGSLSQLSFPSPSSIPPTICYDSFPSDTQFSHSN